MVFFAKRSCFLKMSFLSGDSALRHTSRLYKTRREPKGAAGRGRREGDGGKGTAKKNVTTIGDKRHDNLRHFYDHWRHCMTIAVSLVH